MKKIKRIKTPACLTKQYKNTNKTVQQDRTEKWLRKVNKNKPNWNWYELDKCLKPLLLEMTQKHCAFCDKKFREDDIVPIEHFKPKIEYPENAFEWTNLYPICPKCNLRKGKK